jgi:nucleolar MIF4G domain-containing protein 1
MNVYASLEDFHTTESKSKWLIGAGWGGDPLVVRQTQIRTTNEISNSLLKLARKQGMNTDIRRSIFIVLMV